MKLFGTDGLRGKAGAFPLDPLCARLVGEEVGRLSGGKVVLGGDTRLSTHVARLLDDFEYAVIGEGGVLSSWHSQRRAIGRAALACPTRRGTCQTTCDRCGWARRRLP